MAGPTDSERVDALLADQEASIRSAFRKFVNDTSSPNVIKAIIAKLDAGDVPGALAIVDSYIVKFGAIIPHVSTTVGVFTAAELTAHVAEVAPLVVAGISFDPSHPRAAEIVQAHRVEMVQNLTHEQREATTQAIARAYREGTGTESTARAFRDSIGLNKMQEQYVDNYRKNLEGLDRRALTRALRSKRSDDVIRRAIDNHKPLTPKQIDKYVDQYRRNFLQSRAATIARTEGTQATSEARDESLRQMIEQTGIAPERVEETWNVTEDGRDRDWHGTMQGQKRPLGETFEDGLGNVLRYPGDPKAPANTRVNCRCNKTYEIKPPAGVNA